MLEVYTDEFVQIVRYIISENLGCIDDEGNLAVEKHVLTDLMDDNKYQNSFQKLKTWKGLKWIETEGTRFTRMTKDEKGKNRRMVVINIKIFNTLKKLLPA